MDIAARQTTHGRHFGMDWLRIGAFALLILYHIGMFYVPWDWHVKSDPVVWWATIPMYFANGWRLGLLFLVSGFASAAMLAKRPEAARFVADRSARLLLPLIFAMVVIVPPQPWIELMGKQGYDHGLLHFWTQDYFAFAALHGIVLPTWQHLWFVAYLWPYTLLLAALVSLPKATRTRMRALFARVFSHPLAVAVLPLGWLLLRALVWFPGVENTHALFDDAAAHCEYVPLFLFGFALHRAPDVWGAIDRVWKPALVLALLAYGVVAGIEWRWPGDTPAPALWTPVFRIARTVNAWCMILALLGLAHRFGRRDHPARAVLNEAIFPCYIIHQTIIVVVAWFCRETGVPNLASFPVLLAATTAGCWLFYRVGRDIAILRPLVGLRARRAGHRQVAGLPA